MQIHANSKGKLAWDDITLWANHSMKCHWKNHFTFFDSALCKWGWIFTVNYILLHLQHFSLIFDLQAITTGHLYTKFELCTLHTFHKYEGMPKVWNDDPVPLTLDLLNPKWIGSERLSRTTTVPGFKSFRSEVFHLSC